MHIDGYNYINDVGYGFYAGRLSGATVFDLAARCDSKVSFCSMAKSILGEEKLPLDLTAEDRKKMCDGITRWLEENECSVAEYVATLINYEDDDTADSRLDHLMRQMMRKEEVTEELKRADQMLWIQKMMEIRHRAEEVVLAELIYDDV